MVSLTGGAINADKLSNFVEFCCRESQCNFRLQKCYRVVQFSPNFSRLLTKLYSKEIYIGIATQSWAGVLPKPMNIETEIPHKGPEMRSFDVFFIDSSNKQLNKQSNCLWFKTPLRSCGAIVTQNGWQCSQRSCNTLKVQICCWDPHKPWTCEDMTPDWYQFQLPASGCVNMEHYRDHI